MRSHHYLALLTAILLFAPSIPADEYEVRCAEARGRLLVPVRINNTGPHPFLLDAGVQCPVIHRDTARHLQLPVGGNQSAPSTPSTPTVRAESFAFAGIPPESAELVAADLAPLADRLGVDVAGLLPLYQPGFEVTVQLKTAVVVWRPLAEAILKTPELPTMGMAIDEMRSPVVEFRINRTQTRRLQIDFAYAGTMALSPASIAALAIPLDGMPRLETVIEGGVTQTQVRLDALESAGFTLLRPACTVLGPGEPDRVGLGFLEHFHITLNFEHGLIRFDALGPSIITDDPITGYGLALRRRIGDCWEVYVAANSPADRAGVRAGDLLTSINHISAVCAPYHTLARALFVPPGAQAALTFLRGSQTQTATLIAVPLL